VVIVQGRGELRGRPQFVVIEVPEGSLYAVGNLRKTIQPPYLQQSQYSDPSGSRVGLHVTSQ
jgi:hypothetical protein